ncbi:hypothetical protein [Citricoccus sp. NR2]|uniref:hypothetical protein n=1 Tax=Citricoccus sp. NR2 TaxID=3004095 RepID=UPI0022DD395B|nr:hypothetical protein [Citricoccus sp. NR2]WBL20411.1 hypothetical protein O1A05_06960 [Citricoccus sp. NR2]
MADSRTRALTTAPALLLLTAGLTLTSCTVEPSPEPSGSPSESPSESASSSASVAPQASVDELAEVLLTTGDEALPGELNLSVESYENQPFTMYFSLSEFTTTGQCADLLAELNAFSTQALIGVTGHYEAAASDDEPTPESTESEGDASDADAESSVVIETMVIETADDVDPMSVYSRIPGACDSVDSDELEGSTATFTQLGDLDAFQLSVDDGSGEVETLHTGGGTAGNHHVYIAATGISEAEAETLFTEQINRLEDAFGDDESSSPSPTSSATSPSPTDS